jgi:hypothetical protein
MEPGEGGVQGAFLDGQQVIRGFLNPPGDGITVARYDGQGLEDQQVERALGQWWHKNVIPKVLMHQTRPAG